MVKQEHYYTIEELKIGMRVRLNQLSKITDTYILISDLVPAEDYLGLYTEEGIIRDIYTDKHHVNPSSVSGESMLVFNSSMVSDWSVSYE